MEQKGFNRKLSAVLSADVKGYSLLMRRDEETTVRTLTEYRKVISEFVTKYQGRVVDSPGDNILAEFASVVHAVQCGFDIQGAIESENAKRPKVERMEYRIGINLGDVIQDGERIYGDGVNVAARLESLSEAGGICVSGSAYDQIENKLSFGCEFLGEQTIKNISTPVRVYKLTRDDTVQGCRMATQDRKAARRRIFTIALCMLFFVIGGILVWNSHQQPTGGRIETASVDQMAYPLPENPSIMILPLKPINSESNIGYLADGITENIIINLSKIPSIFVIAPRSSFAYKDKSISFKQVAEEIGVRYILHGSLQKSQNHIRVNAQLVDALNGLTMWAERYDRELKEVFEVQDEITEKVVTALEVKLTEGEQARYRRGQTINSKAYEHYVKGLEHYRRFTPQDNNEALRLFEKAVELDPQYNHARADIGWAELNNWRFRWGEDPKKSLIRSKEIAIAILEVDPGHSTANALLGTIHRYKGEFEQAIEYGRKAMETEPNGSDIIATLATTLMFAGEPEESLDLIERAMRLSPKHPSWYLYTIGAVHRQLGNYDKAVTAHEMWQQKNKRSPNPYLALVYTYSLAGRHEDAIKAATEFLIKRPKFSVRKWRKRAGYADPNEVEKIEKAMLAAGLPE